MQIRVRERGIVTVIDLAGKVTLGEGDESLRDKVAELLGGAGSPRRILVNLEQVPYMDSAGIAALVSCYQRAAETGSTIKLLNPKKRVYDLLHVVKLDQIFECFSDEEQAVESFA